MRLRGIRSTAVAGLTVLALSACSGGGDGGGNALPADASPAEVVAAGLGQRLDNGAAFTFTLEGDLDALAAQAGEPAPPEIEQLFRDGFVSGAFSPDGGFALTLGPGDGFFQLRAVEEAVYLRLDLEALGEFSPEASAAIPPPDALLAQLSLFQLPPDVLAVAEAAVNGEWVGITGLSQESLQSFAESMGAPPADDAEAQQEAVRDLLEDKGLLDGEAVTENYLEVTGEGPTYDVTVMARALVATFNEIAVELEDVLGEAAGDMGELPDAADVPEELSGFSITVEDGRATAISADLATVATAAGEDIDDLEPGDLTATMTLSDLGDQLAVPDATEIAFEDLVTVFMGAMMGGMLGG